MIKLDLKVNDPERKRDRLTKTVYWPVVPRKGEQIFLLRADCQGRVEDIYHWLDCNDIDVVCEVSRQVEFEWLIEGGWKFDGR